MLSMVMSTSSVISVGTRRKIKGLSEKAVLIQLRRWGSTLKNSHLRLWLRGLWEIGGVVKNVKPCEEGFSVRKVTEDRESHRLTLLLW